MADTKATAEDVARLAALARIAIPEESLAGFAAEFDAVLAYVSKLDELTLPAAGDRELPAVHNVFRADGEARAGGTYTEAIVGQFPQKNGNSLSVKQIISHD